jgi:hypothetical protein
MINNHSTPYERAVTFAFDGGLCAARCWGFGGFAARGYRGRLSAGALITVDAVGAGSGPLTPVAVPARVVRADPERGELAVSFLDLDATAYRALAPIVDDLIERLRASDAG